MRKASIILSILMSFVINNSIYSQAKKPTIMVMPEDSWCIANGYHKEYDDQGDKIQIPDYNKAFVADPELKNAITAIQDVMTRRGYNLEDLQSKMNSSRNRNTRRAARSRTTVENPIDAILRDAKPDIRIDLSWTVYKRGPHKNIALIMKGVDAYSDKAIAPVYGDEVESTHANINALLIASVEDKMADFCDKLDAHFQNILDHGREVTFGVDVEEDALEEGLDTRFDGTPLNRIIRSWVSENTVNRNFSVESSSENFIDFNQVRIPMYDNEVAYDIYTWAYGLVDMLENKYKLRTKVEEIGLGRVEILIIK